ncbi:hypothetical protein EMGBS4_14940 [Acidimicrobiaceae bacterium]|nr:hypothetical protein EMGBS4_14940 [Acidimicrobiaceae bacterium]
MSDQSVVTAMTQSVELAQTDALAAIAATKDLTAMRALTADLNKKKVRSVRSKVILAN